MGLSSAGPAAAQTVLSLPGKTVEVLGLQAIGGSLLSNTCLNCSKRIIGQDFLAVGVAGGVVGAIVGGITGQVFGWAHH